VVHPKCLSTAAQFFVDWIFVTCEFLEEATVQTQRREVIKLGAALSALVAAGLLSPQAARAQQAAWNKAAFEAKSLADAVKALGGAAAESSTAIAITAPDIAENGAVVQIGVASKVPNTQSISILVEKNPNIVAASFTVPAGTEPAVTTRVKMGQTSNVHAVVKADNKFFVATKEVKVTLGGCGG
jgi:sulfur-oxidizing protein SoxY